MSDHVWYVAYGSNLCRSRFMAYIEGSDGSVWPKTRGCCDKTPPARDISGKIPGRIYFAEHSKNWDNGGVAFYDLSDTSSEVFVRIYLVTIHQFVEIFEQENGISSDPDQLIGLIDNLESGLFLDYGTGWYKRLIRLPDIKGYPAFTFTSDKTLAEVEQVEPSEKYLNTIAQGLREFTHLDDKAIYNYLSSMT